MGVFLTILLPEIAKQGLPLASGEEAKLRGISGRDGLR